MSIFKKTDIVEYILNFYKCRSVKSPEKFGDAAGWDFFIPDDLTLFDFYNIDFNNFVEYPMVNGVYCLPMKFGVSINGVINQYMLAIKQETNSDLLELIVLKYADTIQNIDTLKISDAEHELLTVKPLEWIKMLPGANILIPSGIHVRLPQNVFLKAENKSGIASKRGLIYGASLIDTDYRGQIHINLINTSPYIVTIKPGEKIIQFVPYFQPNMTKKVLFDSYTELYLNAAPSVRGEGGFGSSGIN